MRIIITLTIILISCSLWAHVPEPIITVGDAQGSFAVVAGKLANRPERPVGISVLNGNIISSTITDAEGRWSLVIRHLSTQLSVTSWDLLNPESKSSPVQMNF